MTRYILDARNLLCPMPVIRTQDRVKALDTGDILEVRCTDPGALNDIPAWCRIHGHEVMATNEDAEGVVVIVRVTTSTST
ncbi:MAG: sulfurtransferase TusA family protein [Gammaproteobacteria bacterium]|jgi:tRNA 2-thiouridine synthesizing protein A|nr:sulfurtransferase TusA family protein [Gammaproteobacteria bacterium]|tara:strand:- start:38 stop:277 length:240 start_codon:yes stop_codon:yes gene_type:complete